MNLGARSSDVQFRHRAERIAPQTFSHENLPPWEFFDGTDTLCRRETISNKSFPPIQCYRTTRTPQLRADGGEVLMELTSAEGACLFSVHEGK